MQSGHQNLAVREYFRLIRMAIWHDLPNEIRNKILFHFSTDLVNDFSVVLSEHRSHILPTTNPVTLDQVHAPSYLTSFASAMRTCRYSHAALTTAIKIDGSSPGELLHELQLRFIRDTWFDLRGSFWQDIDFEAAYGAAGCFWRNTKFFESNTTHWEILAKVTVHRFNPRSRVVLLPHLEEWVQARANDSILVGQRITNGIEDDNDEWPKIQLVCGNTVVRGYDFVFTSVSDLQVQEWHGQKWFLENEEGKKEDGWVVVPTIGWIF